VVLLSICSDVLETDSLQFGFKEKIGTADAIFTLKSTIKYFTDRGISMPYKMEWSTVSSVCSVESC